MSKSFIAKDFCRSKWGDQGMSPANKNPLKAKKLSFAQHDGAVLIILAITLVALLGIIGLAIDIGHAYVNKSQLQNIADACALAGASALNETAAGIVEAQSRATDSGSNLNNKFEFNRKPLAIDNSWVTYSISLNGPWVSGATAQGLPAGIKFVKVAIPATQQSDVIFGSLIPGVSNVINLGAEAVAGRAAQNQACEGVLDPFAVPPGPNGGLGDPTGNFGYVPGHVYEVRFSPGSSGKNCSSTFPLTSTTGNFGFADPDGCGPNVTCLRNALLDPNPGGNCVQISVEALDTTTGNMGNAALKAMQDRFDQDTNSATYTTLAAYNSGYVNSATNGRRIVMVSMTDGYVPPGHSGQYNVEGFGCFFMADRPDASPPSSAICLMYVGNCGIVGPQANSGSSSAPSLTKTVLFK